MTFMSTADEKWLRSLGLTVVNNTAPTTSPGRQHAYSRPTNKQPLKSLGMLYGATNGNIHTALKLAAAQVRFRKQLAQKLVVLPALMVTPTWPSQLEPVRDLTDPRPEVPDDDDYEARQSEPLLFSDKDYRHRYARGHRARWR